MNSKVFTLREAADASPVLAKLTHIMRASNARWEAVKHLIPSPLHAHIRAGAYTDDYWCLLVGNASVAAKLKQIIPDLIAHLQLQALPTPTIHIKVDTHMLQSAK